MVKKIIDLHLLRRWYDMTASGEKNEEYREIKPYWIRRMFMEQIALSDEYRAIIPDVAHFFNKIPTRPKG